MNKSTKRLVFLLAEIVTVVYFSWRMLSIYEPDLGEILAPFLSAVLILYLLRELTDLT